MSPRISASVKFFEPAVSWAPLLAGFDLIRLAELPPLVPVSLLSSPPPHAATPRARTSAAISANAALTREFPVTTVTLLSFGGGLPPGMDRVILCGSFGARQLEPARGEQPLDGREGELEPEREQCDQDGPGDHALIPVHVSAEDQIAERAQPRQRGEGGGRDDVDRRRTHSGHDRRHREGQLDSTHHLEPAHSHAARGLHSVAVDLAHADVG